MPVLGFIIVGRFFIHIMAMMWRKGEIRGLFL